MKFLLVAAVAAILAFAVQGRPNPFSQCFLENRSCGFPIKKLGSSDVTFDKLCTCPDGNGCPSGWRDDAPVIEMSFASGRTYLYQVSFCGENNNRAVPECPSGHTLRIHVQNPFVTLEDNCHCPEGTHKKNVVSNEGQGQFSLFHDFTCA